MASNHLLPGLYERIHVESALHRHGELSKIDVRPRLVQAMKEHSLLNRRERIKIFRSVQLQLLIVWENLASSLSRSSWRRPVSGKSEVLQPPASPDWQ